MKRYWGLTLHFLRYQWRERLLLTLTLSILIGVGTLAAVNFFASSVKQEMDERASALLGADWLVESSEALPIEAWSKRATELNLKTAQTIEFLSMVSANGQLQLGSIKAVDSGYPLRGDLQVRDDLTLEKYAIHTIPQPGEVWLAPRLFPVFNIKVGDYIELGSASFKVTRILEHEPDAGLAFLAMAPRVLMNTADIPQTQLLGFGSRVEYRFLLSGDQKAIQSFAAEIKPQLTAQQEVTDNMTTRPELVHPIDSLLNFLTLSALIIFLLAALSMSLATRTYAEKQTDSTAILRCLGATAKDIRAAYLSSLLVLALMMSILACVLGFSLCWIFIQLAANFWDIILPMPKIIDTIIVSLCTGIILVSSFAWPWLANLQHVPPLRVLQRQLEPPKASSYLVYGSMMVALGILWSFYQPPLLMFYAWSGIILVSVCFAGLTYVLLQWAADLGKKIKMPWRLGLLQMTHAKRTSLIQVGVFAFALTIIFLFILVRQDFVNNWENKFPPKTPNYFVINILPDQLTGVEYFFESHQREVPFFYPMVRARLSAINDKPVSMDDYPKGDAPNVLRRDLNLSYTDQLENAWDQSADNQALISIEESMAKDLNIKVGDTLTFQAGATHFTTTIANLRVVDWYSMQPNFYAITTPSVLMSLPTTYLGSFYIAKSDEYFLNQLIMRFPNLTLLDVDDIISDLQNLIMQALVIVEVLFSLVCLAILLMLWVIACTQADTRAFISAVLRTLGATQGQLLRGWLSEFAIIGFIAGIIAVFFAQVLSLLLAKYIFEMQPAINGIMIVMAPIVGLLIYTGLGYFMLQKLMRTVPLVRLTGD